MRGMEVARGGARVILWRVCGIATAAATARCVPPRRSPASTFDLSQLSRWRVQGGGGGGAAEVEAAVEAELCRRRRRRKRRRRRFFVWNGGAASGRRAEARGGTAQARHLFGAARNVANRSLTDRY